VSGDPTAGPNRSEVVSGPPRQAWIADVSRPEIIGFALWVGTEFALALAGTLVIVHRAVGLPPGAHLSNHFFAAWAITWVGPMLLLSLLAGGLVFRRNTPWEVVLTWPWLIGLAVAVAYFFGLSGQMDPPSRLCTAAHGGSCDTSWGIGAMVLAVAAGAVLGGAFVSAASLKRLALRR
jgi:hypothetical protein